ncbi:MAG: ribosome silencing factor [Acidimicrobiaceae bacterium]|nr:ribosome silencing factor [Acidimicrobiaceae bacterium]HBU75180.1 ribosome silencing factor [Acidimicrobiaceae bacterium]|tara:strand:- start:95 stop:478 length:384 start_codon:yes stop_codon:yes gene_type:complete
MENCVTTEIDESRELALAAARIADAQKGSDIVILQVGEVLGVTEYFVVVSASNRRLVRTLVDEIEVQCRNSVGRIPSRTEGVREQQWVLLDYGDVVVHVFLEEIREFYDIERLYKDVPVIPTGFKDA